MELIIIGGGIGGLTLALAAHAAKAAARIRVFEAAPDIRPLGVGINLGPHAVKELSAARAAGRACRGRLPAAGLRLLHQPRPTRLPRAVGARGRASVAAFFHSSRRPASGPAGCGAPAAGDAKLHHRPPLHRHRAKRCARHRALRRRGRRRAGIAAGRRAGGMRRHPLRGAGAILSGRRTVHLSRHQYVARGDAAAAVPHRPQHRPHRRAAFDPDHLSDSRQYRCRRQPAGQLGRGDRARRRRAGRLEQAGAARGLLPGLPGLDASTGSTCPP